MEEKAGAIGAEDEGNILHSGRIQRLGHAVTKRMAGILRFNKSQGDIGLVVEDEVGAADLAPGMQLASDNDSTFGEGDFLADLGLEVPTGLQNGRSDELRADITLAQVGCPRSRHAIYPFHPYSCVAAMSRRMPVSFEPELMLPAVVKTTPRCSRAISASRKYSATILTSSLRLKVKGASCP